MGTPFLQVSQCHVEEFTMNTAGLFLPYSAFLPYSCPGEQRLDTGLLGHLIRPLGLCSTGFWGLLLQGSSEDAQLCQGLLGMSV